MGAKRKTGCGNEKLSSLLVPLGAPLGAWFLAHGALRKAVMVVAVAVAAPEEEVKCCGGQVTSPTPSRSQCPLT